MKIIKYVKSILRGLRKAKIIMRRKVIRPAVRYAYSLIDRLEEYSFRKEIEEMREKNIPWQPAYCYNNYKFSKKGMPKYETIDKIIENYENN